MSFTPNDVSIVIITRHRPEFLQRCLQSLFDLPTSPREVIIVDNSDPADNRSQRVSEQFANVRYKRLEHTRNCLTLCRNEGIRITSGKIVAFIDDDVTLYPHWLEGCVEGYQDDKAGAVGGRVLDPEVDTNDYHRAAPICDVLPDGSLTDNLECDPGTIIPVRHLRGCNFSCRRDVLDKVNGFDESIQGYGFEELDVCLRIGNAGFKILFNPRMSLYHHLSPRAEISRYDHGNFRSRLSRVRSLTYVYAKSLLGAERMILLRFLILNDTGLRALAKYKDRSHLSYVVAGYMAKMAGLVRWVRWRFGLLPFRARAQS